MRPHSHSKQRRQAHNNIMDLAKLFFAVPHALSTGRLDFTQDDVVCLFYSIFHTLAHTHARPDGLFENVALLWSHL